MSGCASSGHTDAAPAPVSVGQAKAVQNFSQLSDLRRSSDLVVIAEATVQQVGDLAFTTTTMTVTKLLHGASPGPTVKVRQTGSATELNADDPLLEPGEVDLLFLTRFVGPDGKVTDEYVTVGYWQGRYRRSGDKFVHLPGPDNESPLQDSVATAELSAVAGR